MICELDAVLDVLRLEVVVTDCGVGVDEVDRVPLVEGFVVSGTAVADGRRDDVVDCIVEHNASRIPPFLTIPSKVSEFTMTFEHASLTLFAVLVSASAQSAEQPASWKSATVQDGIVLAYTN
jgi:hypothetical protein